MNHTFIISEAGSCHDGTFEKAVSLIDVARNSGADACKFQFWSSAKRLAERRRAPTYLPIYEQYRVPLDWLPRLRAECERRGLEFMVTCYLPEDIIVIEPFVRRFKIASFEAGDRDFLAAHAVYNKPIIVSTGMTTGHFEFPCVATWHALHCISAYPTPVDQANLMVCRATWVSGYSDHTACIYTGAFAVCAGATILEVHIKDWTTAETNPDAPAALNPQQFAEYVRLVRLAERILGSGSKEPMPAEAAMLPYKVQP